MSGATAFDYDSARRIARAVHGFERLQGDRAGGPATTRLDIRQPLVKTPTTLPGGYDGTAPLTGTLVERLPDDTILKIAEVYIKDADDTPLEADRAYLARASGHATVASVTRPLFLVQGVPPADPPLVQLGYYNGGTIFGANGSDINRTNIVVWETGATLTIRGHPWGQDAPAVLTGVGSNNLFGQPNWWQILLRDTEYDTQNWAIVPFMPWCQAQYLSGTSPQVVSCRAYGATGSTAMTWRAWDPLNLVPNPGVYRCIMAPYAALNGTYRIGWQIIWCNSASPVSASSVGVD